MADACVFYFFQGELGENLSTPNAFLVRHRDHDVLPNAVLVLSRCRAYRYRAPETPPSGIFYPISLFRAMIFTSALNSTTKHTGTPGW